MSGPNFSALLSMPADKAERPKPLPAGTFNGLIKSFKFDESKEKKTPYVRFDVAIQSAGEDVEPSDIEGIDFSKKQLRKDFYLTEDAVYRLSEFIASCGKDITGRSYNELIPELVGESVIIAVTQRNGGANGTEIYNDIADIKGA